MTNKNSGLDINEGTAIKIPLANLISLLAATAVAAWAYFGLMERVTFLEHDMDLNSISVQANTVFRECWPLGTCGSLPADAEQFLRIEMMEGQIKSLEEEVEKLKFDDLKRSSDP